MKYSLKGIRFHKGAAWYDGDELSRIGVLIRVANLLTISVTLLAVCMVYQSIEWFFVSIISLICLFHSLYLTYKKPFIASYVFFISVYVMLFITVLYGDIPTTSVDRQMHQYFWLLALACLVIYRRSGLALKYGVSTVFLLTYMFFEYSHAAVYINNMSFDRLFSTLAQRQHLMYLHGAALFVGVCIISYFGAYEEFRRRIQERKLMELVRSDELELFYQPQIEGQKVVCVEALLRHRSDVTSTEFPCKVLPLMEQVGLIYIIDRWVLQQACEQLSVWRTHPILKNMTMSVNISASEFAHEGFVNRLRNLMTKYELPSHVLELEITERTWLAPSEHMIQKTHEIAQMGVGVVLDDFGTGFSTLTSVKAFAVNKLKIDMMFVRDICSDTRSRAIVDSVLMLSRDLGLKVTAEGVETLDQKKYLEAQGCSILQGFLFAKAMPVGDLERFVCERNERREMDGVLCFN